MRRSEIRELLKLTRKPDVISFAGGLPDPELFPIQEVAESSERAVRERGALSLQYSPTEGDPFLREQLAAYMTRSGEDVVADDIIVVSSSQQAIDLIGKVLIDEGDPIVVETPCYVGTVQAYRAYGAEFHGIPMDFEGIQVGLLEKEVRSLCDSGRKPKFVYIIPDFQNPAGVTLTLERRKRVLEIASKYDLLVVEDSPYRELRFTGEFLPSLYSLDTEGRVLQMKTFSKILCPGFRIGWILGPDEVIDKIVVAKQGTDLCTAAFSSIVVAYFIEAGHLEKIAARARELYAKKARVMLDALAEHMPKAEGLSWSEPEGGMFLWINLPDYMDAVDMFPDAVEHKVAYVIGSAFTHDGSCRNAIRLNFSYPSLEQIEEGIKRLATLVKSRVRS